MSEYEMVEMRKKIGEILCELGEKDQRIYVLDSDLAKSTTSIQFKDKFPNRFIETGIAEASAMSIASGIASEGQIPFYVNFAMFVSGTAWTQLRQAAYANLNVKMIATHPGMDNGPDGASHHANEDIALVRSIPNVKVLIPSNIKELKEAIEIAIKYQGPVYIRCSRDVVPNVEFENKAEIGKATIVEDLGEEFALIYEGTAAAIAYKSFQELKDRGYKGKLINIFSIKPIDINLINNIASTVKGIVTIENHSVLGGLGGTIAEIVAQNPKHAKLAYVGVSDVFTESGKTSDVKAKYGLTVENIIKKVETVIK
ncbi:MAG: transketolase [Clostridia bacterium]|jgi:transketolase|nr:transketolase [Clostridia bacterium]